MYVVKMGLTDSTTIYVIMLALLAHRAGALGTPATGFSVFGSWSATTQPQEDIREEHEHVIVICEAINCLFRFRTMVLEDS